MHTTVHTAAYGPVNECSIIAFKIKGSNIGQSHASSEADVIFPKHTLR